jgi:hypothetical protein
LLSAVDGSNLSKLIREGVSVATENLRRATMIAADPRPMSSAPVDGTPVRLFVFADSVIASFWSEGRCREVFGAGDYRAGWYLLDDDVIELDEPMGVGATNPRLRPV